jgi:hypothetical protein
MFVAYDTLSDTPLHPGPWHPITAGPCASVSEPNPEGVSNNEMKRFSPKAKQELVWQAFMATPIRALAR